MAERIRKLRARSKKFVGAIAARFQVLCNSKFSSQNAAIRAHSLRIDVMSNAVPRVWILLGFVLVGATGAIAQSNQPSIVSGGVLDNAAYGANVAPGSLVSIFGSNFASSLSVSNTTPLSTSLGGVSVTFNGISAGVKAVVPPTPTSHDQINAQLPWNVVPSGASGSATVMVTTQNGGSSAPITIPIVPMAPALFALNSQGSGQAVAVNADGTLAGPTSSTVPGFPFRPAKIGDPGGLIFYANGLGPVCNQVNNGPCVNGPPANGAVPPAGSLSYTLNPVTVTVGGFTVQTVYSILTPQFPGVYQVGVFLPTGTPTGDGLKLQIQENGLLSNVVTISVSQ
jgi:uncharacterized protein (TIGR03437 family)